MKKNKYKITSILGIFFFLTAVTTYPLFFKIRSHISGFSSTDEPFAALWNFWWLKYSHLEGLTSNIYSTIVAPFGVNYFKFSIFPFWEIINKWSSIFLGNVITYNLEVVFSFILAGLFMYKLVYFLTDNNYSAIFSGIIYAFCPYHFVRAWQHLGLAQIQWMPLYILSLFLLIKEANLKRAFLSSVCFYLVASFELHYSYFMFIVTIIFILLYSFYKRLDRKYIFQAAKLLTVMTIFILIFTLPNIFAIVNNGINVTHAGFEGGYGFIRPFEDLFTQSARPLSYFLPAATHPVFGEFTEQFIGSNLYGLSLTEHTLYLGWVPLIIAFIALRSWRRRQARFAVTSKEGSINENFSISFFLILAVVSWLFSQPPWWNIFGFKLYMPSFFMYKMVPLFRAYCRFGIVVMLTVAVLAGFGLKFILGKLKKRYARVLLTCLFSGFVLFEFWNWPAYKLINVSSGPAVYSWFRSLPEDFTIAEYPLDEDGVNEMYKFYQTMHEKKIINGTTPGTNENKITKAIVKLSKPKTAGILKWMGVKYVLVHKEDYLGSELMEDREELNSIPLSNGLRFVKSFPPEDCPSKDIMCVRRIGQIDVYEVIASVLRPE